MKTDYFVSFLMRAKAETYASSGDEGGETLPDGRKILTYQEGMLRYEDIYRGMNPFIGTETVYLLKEYAKGKVEPQEKDWKALWTMNYAGKVVEASNDSENSFAKEVYQALREALKFAPKEAPFRGPASFFSRDAKYFYVNRWTGDILFFRGEEYIYDAEGEVYRLDYHGTLLQPF